METLSILTLRATRMVITEIVRKCLSWENVMKRPCNCCKLPMIVGYKHVNLSNRDVIIKILEPLLKTILFPRDFRRCETFVDMELVPSFIPIPTFIIIATREPNGQMAPGHTFTIEPMICEGSAKPLTWPDEWTATTHDGKRSAQFEHTLLVTKDGVEALTGKLETSPLQVWERNCKIHKGFWLGNTPEARERAEKLTELALAREAQEIMEDANNSGTDKEQVEERQTTE